MIWNEAMECLPRKDLAVLQRDRLLRVVERVYERVPFYRERLDHAGIGPDAIRRLEDVERLPFTRKMDLRDHYPFGLFAVPRQEIVRLHASTGTTGKPTLVGYTRDDLQTWAELCARCLAMSGAGAGMVFQNAYGYGLFTGGLGLHGGAELLGLTVVPASTGNTARQILLLQDLGTEVLACTPSYALALADALAERGIAPEETSLRVLLLGAEPWTETMRQQLEMRLRVDALNIYGLSEVMGPGVSNECVEAKEGAHVFEDHFLVEVIEPTTGAVLPDGEVGELVFTTLTKQALPLLRYRTGDLASLTREPCRCGRTSARMSRVVGRTDDMVIVRGVNLYPSQVEAALAGVEGITAHHQIILKRPRRLDEVEVWIETTAELFPLEATAADRDHGASARERRQHLEYVIGQRLHSALGVQVSVTLVPPNQLPRSDGGKLKRVVDQRSGGAASD